MADVDMMAALRKALCRSARKKAKSWWCDQCSTEVYDLRCKYCGKAEDEAQ